MTWKIANIDDLSENEREELELFSYYRLFRGSLFLIHTNDLKQWETDYKFDSWFVYDFPSGYIDAGWLHEDIDNIYNELSELIYNYKGSKALERFNLILDNEHPTKSIEHLEEHILNSLSKWKEKDLIKYSDETEWLNWFAKELSKV